jgi:hypothetical protein
MPRDNFSKSIIKVLQLRVGNRCSNPDCRAPTSAPHSSPEKAVCGGEASHIHAAAMGGPRFDPMMSRTSRMSIANAIWLCKTCARKIDVDESAYPADLLRKWKASAEQSASTNLGRPDPPSQTLDTLTQALTGMPRKTISSALPNVAQASKHAIEAQNPYINVDIQYKDGTQTFIISPKENQPPLTLTFSSPAKLSEQILQKIDEGLPFSSEEFLSMKSNQPFLDEKEVKISINPDNEHPACVRLFSKSEPAKYVTVNGTARIGRALLSFKGFLGRQFLEVNLNHPIEDGNLSKTGTANITSGNYSNWEGQPVSFLPDFPNLRILHNILDKSDACIELHIDGHKVTGCNLSSMSAPSLGKLIQAIEALTYFDEHLGLNCKFSENDLRKIDIPHLLFIKDIWENGPVVETSLDSISMSVTMTDSQLATHRDLNGKSGLVRLVRDPEILQLFGQQIQIPRLEIHFEDALLTILDHTNPDDTTTVRLTQIPNSNRIYRLESPPSVIS